MCLKGTNSNTAYDVKMRIQKLLHHFGELGVSQKVGKKAYNGMKTPLILYT